MIITRPKDCSEIIVHIEGKKLALIGCDVCAKLCHTGGEEEVKGYAEFYAGLGYQIVTCAQVEGVCNELLTGKFVRSNKLLGQAETILLASCGNGVQVLKDFLPGKNVLPILDTLFLGSLKNHHLFQERCSLCGNCILGRTEGICPLTQCAKFILNGPCGGSMNGKCEVDPGKDCAWYQIYERMKNRGKEHLLEGIFLPTNHSEELIPRKLNTRK
ncbi:MAG: methylenetetrahydrofolate reductase C-terminal domain-containing protein [Candidatus Wallbacteria bacterium]|nr:methylenetetrahydrofolate reductase C-terminal domain-containing protein [Candidatus Wallbacteria bacterium]